MHLTGCKNLKDGFIKNEYILDLEKSLMNRNYIYDNKTFKKYKSTDLSVKQENSLERFIYEDEINSILIKLVIHNFTLNLFLKKIVHNKYQNSHQWRRRYLKNINCAKKLKYLIKKVKIFYFFYLLYL